MDCSVYSNHCIDNYKQSTTNNSSDDSDQIKNIDDAGIKNQVEEEKEIGDATRDSDTNNVDNLIGTKNIDSMISNNNKNIYESNTSGNNNLLLNKVASNGIEYESNENMLSTSIESTTYLKKEENLLEITSNELCDGTEKKISLLLSESSNVSTKSPSPYLTGCNTGMGDNNEVTNSNNLGSHYRLPMSGNSNKVKHYQQCNNNNIGNLYGYSTNNNRLLNNQFLGNNLVNNVSRNFNPQDFVQSTSLSSEINSNTNSDNNFNENLDNDFNINFISEYLPNVAINILNDKLNLKENLILNEIADNQNENKTLLCSKDQNEATPLLCNIGSNFNVDALNNVGTPTKSLNCSLSNANQISPQQIRSKERLQQHQNRSIIDEKKLLSNLLNMAQNTNFNTSLTSNNNNNNTNINNINDVEYLLKIFYNTLLPDNSSYNNYNVQSNNITNMKNLLTSSITNNSNNYKKIQTKRSINKNTDNNIGSLGRSLLCHQNSVCNNEKNINDSNIILSNSVMDGCSNGMSHINMINKLSPSLVSSSSDAKPSKNSIINYNNSKSNKYCDDKQLPLYNDKDKGKFNSNKTGVHFSKYDKSWVARINSGGKIKKRYFSEKVYGFEEAKRRAIQCRLKMEHEIALGKSVLDAQPFRSDAMSANYDVGNIIQDQTIDCLKNKNNNISIQNKNDISDTQIYTNSFHDQNPYSFNHQLLSINPSSTVTSTPLPPANSNFKVIDQSIIDALPDRSNRVSPSHTNGNFQQLLLTLRSLKDANVKNETITQQNQQICNNQSNNNNNQCLYILPKQSTIQSENFSEMAAAASLLELDIDPHDIKKLANFANSINISMPSKNCF